jgi:hypothetical protein
LKSGVLVETDMVLVLVTGVTITRVLVVVTTIVKPYLLLLVVLTLSVLQVCIAA